MSKIHPWLIAGTASLLRAPKLIIVIPILLVFLLAYDAVYDMSLRPLNGKLVSHFSNFTLHDGLVLTVPPLLPSWPPHLDASLLVARLTWAADNTLRYSALEELVAVQAALAPSTAYILSPVAQWPVPLLVEAPTADDKHKAEKHILKTLNLEQNHALTNLFFDRLGKKNHMIQLAGHVYIYAFFNASMGTPDFNVSSPGIRLLETRIGSLRSLVGDFQRYFQFLSGDVRFINSITSVWFVVEFVAFVVLLLHIYLSICNQHKIRSNVGLMIGWLTENLISAFASLCVISHYNGIASWYQAFGPLGWRALPSYFITMLLFSSRNLVRTINDLAGDNAFGTAENLHKRVIKYYLGINSSVQNSQGVFWASMLVRKIFMLDVVSTYVVPIPNTTVILLVNSIGITLATYILRLISALTLGASHHVIFCNSLNTYLWAGLLALALDHFLQLTFLVGIIVIDLNRVDLTDLLSKNQLGSKTEDTHSTIHEVNPISAYLLGLHGKPAAPNTLRYRLGTYCLKISPASTARLWSYWVPVLALPPTFYTMLLLHMAIPETLAADPIKLVPLAASDRMEKQSYDFLFYSELLTIVVFVIAISQLTFTLTYSKRQRKEVDSDEITALLTPDSGITNAELAKGDEIKFFESITLSGAHESDILKLQSNTKCSFLVSTDLDHKVLVWSPLSKVEKIPINISTVLESADPNAPKKEFWPINDIVISDDGNYIVLINTKHCRIKCFDRKTMDFAWEISLTSEFSQDGKKMQTVAAFFRKKTVAGFLARKLLLKKKAQRRRNSAASILSATTMTGNYPPPIAPVQEADEDDTPNKSKEIEDSLHREEFVMVLESGEMITFACDELKTKVYNPLTQIFEGQKELLGLKIISLKLLKTARVNDRVICNLSNDDIIVGTAVNNIWRFNKLEIDTFFSAQPAVNFAPPLMSRTGSAISLRNDFSTAFELQRQNYHDRPENDSSVFSDVKKYPPINQSAIITIDFVGMVVRVKDLQAQLVDIHTGTIVKVFDIGHFKPGTFRVVHSEPTHCKFCGCASFESVSLVYQDFYEKLLIIQTFTVENKKSRNNICLRVERDPREIRCVGFDSVIEKHFWFDNMEMWEVTDMNVIVGIRKNEVINEEVAYTLGESGFSALPEDGGFTSLRNRMSSHKPSSGRPQPTINDLYQGFVITAQNGKLLEYSIPIEPKEEADFACTRPNYIVKYGYKSVAIAFGHIIKILFLGGDNLIESDLYYSGTTSTLNAVLKPSKDGVSSSNELLFINKRRRMQEKKTKL